MGKSRMGKDSSLRTDGLPQRYRDLAPTACPIDAYLLHILNLGPEDVFMPGSRTSDRAQHIHFEDENENGNRWVQVQNIGNTLGSKHR
jgi:hypothetical protein